MRNFCTKPSIYITILIARLSRSIFDPLSTWPGMYLIAIVFMVFLLYTSYFMSMLCIKQVIGATKINP